MSLPEVFNALYFYNSPLSEWLSAYHYPVQEQLEDLHISVQYVLQRDKFWRAVEKDLDKF